jgi:hypothetical protein
MTVPLRLSSLSAAVFVTAAINVNSRLKSIAALTLTAAKARAPSLA